MPILTKRTTLHPHSKYHPTLEIGATIAPGASGKIVKLIQEWLALHRFHVAIDSKYGDATAQIVKDFQGGGTGLLPVTGEVDPQTFAMLVRPMMEALRPITAPSGATMGQMVVACAMQHLAQGAREVGGQNRGPWVRLYLQGRERPLHGDLPARYDAWCAGFATTIAAQAARSIAPNHPVPLGFHTSCNDLAVAAEKAKRLHRGEKVDRTKIPTGSLMLLRRDGRKDRWHHTGIVVQSLGDFVRTIEGNTTNRTTESPTGDVCRKTRHYRNMDFIFLD